MAADTDRGFTPAELVRIHEANCQLEFLSPEEQNFRIAWMKLVARKAGLPELKDKAVSGPGTGIARPKRGGEQ